MTNSERISNTFEIYSFLGIVSIILTGSALFIMFANRIWGNIENDPIFQSLAILFVLGIICLIAMPHCFRVVRSMRILDFSYSDPGNIKVTIHAVFQEELRIPDEINLKQIISITRDKVFSNLMEFTFENEGEQKKITSFIKKGKVNFIRNLPQYQSI